MKKLTVAVALFVLSTTTSRAGADDSSDARDVERAGAEVHQLAGQSRDRRVAMIVDGAATGALLLPSGIVLVLRSSDDVGNILGTGLIVSGSVALALGALELTPSSVERMADTFDARRAAGSSNADLLRLSYAEWRDAAASARRTRSLLGGAETILGAVSIAVGMTMLLANEGLFGFDRNRQYRVGSISMGAGIPFLGVGLRTLFIQSAEERLWSMNAPAAERVPMVSGFMLQGGGGVSLGYAY
jgi:hypothetical protein